MQKVKSEKGITLVALIITIIVLIILAAVTIMAVQDSDLIGRTQNATIGYAANQKYENNTLDIINSKVASVEAVVSSINGNS